MRWAGGADLLQQATEAARCVPGAAALPGAPHSEWLTTCCTQQPALSAEWNQLLQLLKSEHSVNFSTTLTTQQQPVTHVRAMLYWQSITASSLQTKTTSIRPSCGLNQVTSSDTATDVTCDGHSATHNSISIRTYIRGYEHARPLLWISAIALKFRRSMKARKYRTSSRTDQQLRCAAALRCAA